MAQRTLRCAMGIGLLAVAIHGCGDRDGQGTIDSPPADGGAMTDGSVAGLNDQTVYGGMMGTATDPADSMSGGLGFGISGGGAGQRETGRYALEGKATTGGGRGWGTVGGGAGYGTIGHGSGTGSGYGTGSGRGAGGASSAGRSARHSRAAASHYGAQLLDEGTGRSSGDRYAEYGVNPFISVSEDALSTFAVDVDTGAYTILRRTILAGEPVVPAAVRVEELLNYFAYDYAGPSDDQPFAVHMDAAPCPFSTGTHILRIGVQGKQLARSERMPANLVFLVDVSGSMNSPDKLALAKRALRILVDNLNDGDTMGLVTYASSVREVLQPTGLADKTRILDAIEELSAGGSTAMGSGIELAYRMAAKNLREGSVSRVIVLSDGDANVGATRHAEILDTIRGHVKEGVTLSTIGFGMGNYRDDLMEQLADQGNGNYYYIDGISEARRVFQEQLGATLQVIAKDVKIQVELHPEAVKRYRLVGYENRDVADRDFRNDRVDAGELGAGHSVTALYEVELVPGSRAPLATVRLRAKAPRGVTAKESVYLFDRDALAARFADASDDLRFATAVMGFAEILRKSPHATAWKLADVARVARQASTGRPDRIEFLSLLERL